jgi:hypothetical protein
MVISVLFAVLVSLIHVATVAPAHQASKEIFFRNEPSYLECGGGGGRRCVTHMDRRRVIDNEEVIH